MSANTPVGFIKYVQANYPELLNPKWQRGQVRVLQDIYDPGHVLVGKRGFESLVNPHKVVNAVQLGMDFYAPGAAIDSSIVEGMVETADGQQAVRRDADRSQAKLVTKGRPAQSGGDSAPYFHDGSATTLYDVLARPSPGSEHDVGHKLSEAEIQDLLTFLLALPFQ